jgi:folate-binding Fe-S cluster repair protein YgfZ
MASTLQSAVALDLSTQIEAALHGAAVALANSRAFLRITGPDATRWLNGMVTNSIPSLAPGEGNYNFILNAQGRILGDCTIYREPKADAFLLATEASQLKPIHDHLDKFIIMDDVELQPEPSNVQSCSIIGPTAPAVVPARLSSQPQPSSHAFSR